MGFGHSAVPATGIAPRTVQEVNAKIEGREFKHKNLKVPEPKEKKVVAEKRGAEWMDRKDADSIPTLPNMYAAEVLAGSLLNNKVKKGTNFQPNYSISVEEQRARILQIEKDKEQFEIMRLQRETAEANRQARAAKKMAARRDHSAS